MVKNKEVSFIQNLMKVTLLDIHYIAKLIVFSIKNIKQLKN